MLKRICKLKVNGPTGLGGSFAVGRRLASSGSDTRVPFCSAAKEMKERTGLCIHLFHQHLLPKNNIIIKTET